MILLLDLHERPFMPEAAKSRSFIDQVFLVFGEHGNYSNGDGGSRPLMEGGLEAWRMLWRLRKKAYEKAGIPVPEVDETTDETSGHTRMDHAVESVGCAQFIDAARAAYPKTPPLPPQTANLAQAPPGGFEELLHMDTIIDAEDKAFFTEEVTASFERGVVPPEPLFGEGEGEPPLDMMDFDWEEWDQVFGKSVFVDDVVGS